MAANDCPNIDRCPMFPLFTSQSMLRVMQIHYCKSGYMSCARYVSMSSGTKPPPALLPDGTLLETLASKIEL